MGVIPVPNTFPERQQVCTCMHLKEIVRNVERGWPGLLRSSQLRPGATSDLWPHVNSNLRVTSSLRWFKANLRWCAFRKPPSWDFKVVSDVDLMRAWLGSVALSGQEIIDPDAAAVSLRHLTLLDLIEPPTLLVIRIGIKTAANKEMPNVLLETLLHRTHLDKPTWVYNDWAEPFDESMRSFSYEAAEYLSDWPTIRKRSQQKRVARSQSAAVRQAEALVAADELVDDEEGEEESGNDMDLQTAFKDTPEAKPKKTRKKPEVVEEPDEEPDEPPVGARRTISFGAGSARPTVQPSKPEKDSKSANWKKQRGKR